MAATVRYKPGVSDPSKACQQVRDAIAAAAEVTPLRVLMVNSINDDAHRAGSYHFVGQAVDFQTKLMKSGDEVAFARALAARLGCTEERKANRDWWQPGGKRYRVLLESLNVDGKEHVHVEWRG